MNSTTSGRRSSTNPVRVSIFDREDKNQTRIDSRRTIIRSKSSISASDGSHIPRPRLRSSSSDQIASNRTNLKATGKTPLHQNLPTTPITPSRSCNRFHIALPTGPRSTSPDNRSSSVGGKLPRKDIRPLNDKAYQTYMLSTIDNYFHQMQLSSMLNNNGSIKPLTLKMFVELCEFLVKQIEAKQILTVNNYIEELPKIAKRLCYSGTVTKSWLKTANAMHSWPNVLAWLCWLVEVCQVKDLALMNFHLEDMPFRGTDQKIESSKTAFFFLLDMYNAWNDEKLEEEALLFDKYLQEFQKQQGVTEDDFKKAHTELQAETLKFQAIEEKVKIIDEETQNKEEVLRALQNDELKQSNDLKDLEIYLDNLNVETEKINTECNVLSEQLKSQNIQHENLLSRIKEQPMSKAEKDTILTKCTEMRIFMSQFEEHLKDIQKEIYTLDIKIASVNSNLNKIVLSYNKEILVHFGSNINVNAEELKMPEKELLHPDIMDKLNEKVTLLNNIKNNLNKQLVEKESFIENSTAELEVLQEKYRVLEEENKIVDMKLKEHKSYMNKLKTDFMNDEAKLREQIQILQNDIQKDRESIPSFESIMSELEEAKEKLGAVQRKKMYIEQNAKLFFDKLYEILDEHKSNIVKILEKNSPNTK